MTKHDQTTNQCSFLPGSQLSAALPSKSVQRMPSLHVIAKFWILSDFPFESSWIHFWLPSKRGTRHIKNNQNTLNCRVFLTYLILFSTKKVWKHVQARARHIRHMQPTDTNCCHASLTLLHLLCSLLRPPVQRWLSHRGGASAHVGCRTGGKWRKSSHANCIKLPFNLRMMLSYQSLS